MNNPKISIIMPVLNRGATIEKAIRSVIEQHYDNLEFIILDGGSTDQTVAIIEQYASHLTYWHSKPDASAASAVNMGIGMATGDLIAQLMADDWFEPGIFQRLAAAYNAHPDADMITFGGKIVRYDEATQSYEPIMTFNDPDTLKLNFYNICYAVSVICCRFIKKSLFDRIGLYIPLDAHGQQVLSNDKEFLLRAVLHNAKDIFIEYDGYTYLAHKGSFSFGNNRASSIKHCREHMDFAQLYLQTKTLTLKQRAFLIFWYNDQATRLVLYKLIARQWRDAVKVMKEVLRKYYLLWPMLSCVTGAWIVWRWLEV